MEIYDLIIIGTGPAGLTSAIYAARYRLNFLCIGKLNGGTMTEAHQIQNYPGLPDISGLELAEKFKDQAVSLGANFIEDDIRIITKEKDFFSIKGNNGQWHAKNIIFALGTERRKLSVPGEKEFSGKGVSYCATCDAFFFKKKTVAIVGGGDSAATAAIYLGDLAQKVFLIYRGKELKAEPAWIEKINKARNIEVILNENLKEIKGENTVKNIVLENNTEINVDGVFIEIGSTPAGELLRALNIKTDQDGYIIVDGTQKSNIGGIYAAGDISTNSSKLKQIITSCAEGAVAANAIYQKIKKS